ncbi:hypothetical protein EXS61_01115 [Candidatus Parcubacteria bacterium]|nr:hypothetical protein [Candidatus Parcubacteria bacterium]
MSKSKLVYSIHDELKRLNEQIDLKIIIGQSYVREAKAHKSLRAQLSQARRNAWLTRSFGFASFL